MKKNNKGFTLAELLIVVAIIAVLVAIAIPIFTAQLEKSREAVDAANIRAAYAEVIAAEISGVGDTTKTIKTKQATAGWSTPVDLPANLYETTEGASKKVPATPNTVTITSTTSGASIDCSKTLGE